MARRTLTFPRLAALVAALSASTLAHGGLRESVELALSTGQLGSATVGVSIRDCDSGRELVAVSSSVPLIPASNMKLITSGAALHGLGADFRFQTKLLLDGDRLVVLGDGDPGFGDPELLAQMSTANSPGMDVESFLALWTDAVTKRSVESISDIVVDDRIFDRQFVHPSWPVEQLNTRSFAEASGFCFHLNVLHFFPRPVDGPRPDISEFQPRASWLTPLNRATCDRNENDGVWIARAADTNELTFYGNVKYRHREPVPVTVHDPADFFAQLLADRLVDRGVRVGGHRAARKDDAAPSLDAECVGPIITTPIATAITRCNRDSQNLYAECLLKRVGHELTGQSGSWTNGSAIARNIVHERLDRPALVGGLVIADGSGLSRDNRIAPQTLTAWLASFHNDDELASVFIDSLATGGESGTLASRFASVDLRGATVHAKTGFIEGVSCLSGFVTSRDGQTIAFSVMVNDLKATPVRSAKLVQERIVAAIAEHLSATAMTFGGE